MGLEKINELRASIYNIDIALCHLLAERFNVSRRVGKVKKEYNIPPLVESRWHKILQSKTRLAKKLHIDPTLIQSLLELIHGESLRIQNEIISN